MKFRFFVACAVTFLFTLPSLTSAQRDSIAILDSLHDNIFQVDLSRGLEVAEDLMRITEGDEGTDRAIALRDMGISYLVLNQLDSSLTYLSEGLGIAKAVDDQELIGSISNSLGVVYGYLEAYDKATEYYLIALEIRRTSGDMIGVAQSYVNLALGANSSRNYTRARRYFQQAIPIFLSNQDSSSLAIPYANLSNTYNGLGYPDSAYFVLSEGIRLVDKEKQTRAYATLLNNKGIMELERKEYTKAQKLYSTLLDVATQMGSREHYIDAQFGLSAVAMSNNKNLEAIEYLQQALFQSKAGKLILREEDSYVGLSDAYTNLNQLDSVLHYLKLRTTIKDSITTLQNAAITERLATVYEVDKTNQELSASQERVRLDNQIIFRQNLVIGLGLFSFLLIAYLFYQRIKNSNILEGLNAKLEVKNKEIKHRTQDSLTTIVSILSAQGKDIVDRDPKEVIKSTSFQVYSIAALNELMTSGEQKAIDLKQYLKMIIDKHLQIEEQKHPTVEFIEEITPLQLDPQYSSDIGLIINELTRNSFKHSFQNIDVPQVFVSARTDNSKNELVITYKDNGSKAYSLEEAKKSSRKGLKLVTDLVLILSGTIRHQFDKGSTYVLTFPLNELMLSNDK